MFKDLERNYKERSPEDSIRDIETILANMSIDTEIICSNRPMESIFSHRVEIMSEGVGVFGTNGKGRTETYSLASAYAELIERVQNGFFSDFDKDTMLKLKDEFGFIYFPDEKLISREEFMALPDKVFNDCVKYEGRARENFIEEFFGYIEKIGFRGVLGIPFFDTLEGKSIYIPYNLMISGAGSNGMAAGNTVLEATFQALCELMERWCASRVYYERLTPPDVPEAFLKNYEPEYSMLKAIEKKGYKAFVKDFSAGWKMPALGLLIIDKKENKYQLNVGCESNFNIALSRCITEMYQGIKDDESFKEKLLDIPEKEYDYFLEDTTEKMDLRREQFRKFTTDNSGKFPFSLFGSTEDYSFDPEVFGSAATYEEEVQRYVKAFHKRGFNVYIRDTSYLGFPSVFVYIPEVSFMGKKSISVDNSRRSGFPAVEMDKIRPLFYKTRHCNDENLRKIAEGLESCAGSEVFDIFKLNMKDESPLSELPVSFLVSLLWYKLKDFGRSYKFFKEFYNKRSSKLKYYDVVERYLELRSLGKAPDEIYQIVIKEFDSDGDLVDTVHKDLQDSSSILKHLPLPSCPDCEDCPLEEDCNTRKQLEISRRIYNKMKEKTIKQRPVSAL